MVYWWKFYSTYLICFPGDSDSKESACNVGDPGSIPGLGRYAGGENDNSLQLVWKIPWTEEPGRLQSRGSQRAGHDWASNTYLTCIYLYEAHILNIFFSGEKEQ